MPRRPKEKIDIDVVPYLSIMVIVLKLICLILIVTVMRIALNPQGVKAVAIKRLYGQEHKSADGRTHIKEPTYFDCTSAGVTLYPGEVTVPVTELSNPDNLILKTIGKIKANASNEYAIMLIRPRGTQMYRYLQRELEAADIDVGYDVFDSDVAVNFSEAQREAGINTNVVKKPPEAPVAAAPAK